MKDKPKPKRIYKKPAYYVSLKRESAGNKYDVTLTLNNNIYTLVIKILGDKPAIHTMEYGTLYRVMEDLNTFGLLVVKGLVLINNAKKAVKRNDFTLVNIPKILKQNVKFTFKNFKKDILV